MPIPIPTRSMSRKRTPRSRTKLRVPWVRLASQGAPKNPIHRPSSVDTTYHSGGTEAVAMACISRGRLAGDGAGDEAEERARRAGRPGTRRRRRRATSSPGAWSAGGPRAYRGTGRRPRPARRRCGRRATTGQAAPTARGPGAVGAWVSTVGQTAGPCPAAWARWRGDRRRRGLLHPLAGHVPGGDGPGGARGRADRASRRPAGLRIGHR